MSAIELTFQTVRSTKQKTQNNNGILTERIGVKLSFYNKGITNFNSFDATLKIAGFLVINTKPHHAHRTII